MRLDFRVSGSDVYINNNCPRHNRNGEYRYYVCSADVGGVGLSLNRWGKWTDAFWQSFGGDMFLTEGDAIAHAKKFKDPAKLPVGTVHVPMF